MGGADVGEDGLALALDLANRLAVSLETPALLISLHRDITDLQGSTGRSLRKKQQALRWGIFSWSYSATEAFFNDLLQESNAPNNRTLPLNPDKLRNSGTKIGVKLFTNEWGVRTIGLGKHPERGNRARWRVYQGAADLRNYMADMKELRDILSHGGDPFTMSNRSGALNVTREGNSLTLREAEGFLQACTDLASQTVLAFGGDLSQLPDWPEPQRSGLSAESMPSLALLSKLQHR